MLSEEEAGMDYDELTLNPLLAEIEAETTELDSKKEKQRRYWTAKEEQRFFEIWGRDNWRLTRHGKNTIFFAKWAIELKDRFDIDVKQEEIQAKVNQTRAKFRQVKKQIAADKNCVRWKKFAIIDKILKNQYRPKDASPVPKEALENNRDIDLSEVSSPPSPSRSARQSSPTSITSSSNTQEAPTNASVAENNNTAVSIDVPASTEDIDIKVEGEFLADSSITTTLFNTTAELFSDPIDEVKAEFPSEYHTFGNYPQPNHFESQPPTQDDDYEEPQLHTLQTPQQLLEQQQQQQQLQEQQQYQQYRPPASSSAPPPDTTTVNNSQHPDQLLQQHAQQNPQQAGYDHSGNSYAANQIAANQNHYTSNTTPAAATSSTQQQASDNPVYNNQYAGNTNHNNTASASSSAATMQPPTSGLGRGAPGQPRRRRTTHVNNMVVSAQGGTDSLESMYLNEVRKKNILLAEQLEISRKRMLIEERKVNLLERFFPKCLEMQEQILEKLNNNT
ncbi:PREDICTED: TNF receptor-associated factor family protein DDB_G0272098 [Rhagoletis zephyria]|uniref:TNF receptor-associated factor family protein DDB_G0272098 n=1 Tax=Rhagoletis zephyria TaxID=28612 RepID=UPI00081163CD|nr:PREDICTED: TNF receptor-associated factor family protein DDB_G0272098 [Rhagoletis zephyria]XP_036321868.1 TNF receptor-associated factor family protein DDB_G0272098 [Rhagoletis pomonella]